MKAYAATITHLDASVGRLLDHLRKKNDRNTLVIFTSDNGSDWSRHGQDGPGKRGPYRGGKWERSEGASACRALPGGPARCRPARPAR